MLTLVFARSKSYKLGILPNRNILDYQPAFNPFNYEFLSKHITYYRKYVHRSVGTLFAETRSIFLSRLRTQVFARCEILKSLLIGDGFNSIACIASEHEK